MKNKTNPLAIRQDKDIHFISQEKTIFLYLKDKEATASMASKATGIPQKNICRYKRDLELAGKLWETEKKHCKATGFKAWYLTTNPDQSPTKTQLDLFEDE